MGSINRPDVKVLVYVIGLFCLWISPWDYIQAQCPDDNEITLSNGQTFTVPDFVNQVTIEVSGAEGGNAESYTPVGGKGATIVGTFFVAPGDHLLAIVGMMGNSSDFSGGGGGGSAVTINNAEVVIVAGGGGGAGDTYDGNSGGSELLSGNGTVMGAGGSATYGGGGGGFLVNGEDAMAGGLGGGGGAGLLTGNGAGGTSSVATGGLGFGGGGGAGFQSAEGGGGGGGGYAGGDGNVYESAGGGTSFYNDTRIIGIPTHNPGDNTGDGSVRICWADPEPIPTISQWSLIILGLCLSIFGFVAVRRKVYNPV